MPEVTMHSSAFRYALFALLYFVQGAIMSFFTALNAIYLLSFNVTMSQVGLMGLLVMLPFVLKIFLGILSDKVSLLGLGYRKPYIILGLLLQALCLVAAVYIDPGTHFWLYALTGFLLMTGMALYDTTTDGLALDTTQPSEEGTVQGLMVGARALGVVVISAVIGTLAESSSWQAAFWFLALITLLPLLLVFKLRESGKSSQNAFDWHAFSSFKALPIIALGVFGALYSLIINGTNQIVNPFFQEVFNFGPQKLGLFTMLWGIGVVAGSISGGKLVDSIGKKRSVFLSIAIAFITILLFVIIRTPLLAVLAVIVFGVGYGFYETVYFALSMQRTDPRIAASMFSILMAVANIGTGVGMALTGSLVDGVGYPPTFLIIALLNLLALPLLPLIFKAPAPRPR